MKQILLILTLFVLSTSGFSQKYLTNRQVYNFSVGDIYEWETYSIGGPPSPPQYSLQVIRTKWYSVTGDTLYYTDSLYSKRNNSCPTCTDSTYSAQLDTLLISPLDSSAIPLSDSLACNACGKSIYGYDSLYTDSADYCTPKRVFEQIPPAACGIDSCNVATIVSYMVIEGCGGVYTTLINNIDDVEYEGTTNLVYYKKHDTVCGTFVDIVAGINNLPIQLNSLSIYPIPVLTEIRVNTTIPSLTSYTITDLTGRICGGGKYKMGQPIVIEYLPAGQYFITFTDSNLSTVVKKFSKL